MTGPAAGSRQERSAATQADGRYTFSGLVPGEYTGRVEHPGFARSQKAVSIEASRTQQFPIQLTLESAKQEITVAAAASRVVAGADLDALPGDPDDLASMLTALAGF